MSTTIWEMGLPVSKSCWLSKQRRIWLRNAFARSSKQLNRGENSSTSLNRRPYKASCRSLIKDWIMGRFHNFGSRDLNSAATALGVSLELASWLPQCHVWARATWSLVQFWSAEQMMRLVSKEVRLIMGVLEDGLTGQISLKTYLSNVKKGSTSYRWGESHIGRRNVWHHHPIRQLVLRRPVLDEVGSLWERHIIRVYWLIAPFRTGWRVAIHGEILSEVGLITIWMIVQTAQEEDINL
jgi:hypothetical protein